MLKKIIIQIIIINVIFALFTGLAYATEDDDPIVEFECENFKAALQHITSKEELRVSDLNRITGTADFSQWGITSIQGIEHLIQVDIIVLTGNYIEDVTPLFSLPRLKEISINYNNLTEIPEGFSDLKRLNHFDISYNPISKLPTDINDFDALKYLCIDYCNLSELGDISGIADTLQWFVMPGNPVTEWGFLQQFSELEFINLNECNLNEVPDLSKNRNLKYLYVANNEITELPDYLSAFDILRIDASYNYLQDIPNSYANFTNMNQLVLTNNFIEEFPIEVLAMKEIRVLMLGENLISEIPLGIGNLDSLQRLSLSSNNITSIEYLYQFELPFPYQMGLYYNHIDLEDEDNIEYLETYKNPGGMQKYGSIDAVFENVETNGLDIAIDINYDNFIELQNINFYLDDIYVFDLTSEQKEMLYHLDEVDQKNPRVSINVNLNAGQTYLYRVLLAITIDTYPQKQLYYYKDIAAPVIAPTASPVPTASPTPSPTPYVSPTPRPSALEVVSDALHNYQHTEFILIGILLIAFVVMIVLIMVHRKKTKENDQ